MTFYYCHFGNIGDRMSCPKRYFPEWKNGTEVYPSSPISSDQFNKRVIIGGGGMFMSGMECIHGPLSRMDKRIVVWGVGTNLLPFDEPWWAPDVVNTYALVGIRDYGIEGYDYVPCVSCMDKAFNETAEPIHEFMVYQQDQHPITLDAPVKISTAIPTVQIAVQAILSAKTVVTNSYHGAYWGQLLGRRVLLFKPWGNKFAFFKHRPEICDESNVTSLINGAPTAPPWFRAECRDLNWSFYQKVKAIL